MSIFDLVKAPEIAAYWNAMEENRAPFLGDTLFPSMKKLGLNLSWIKGGSGAPVELKLSAFDVKAVPRPRIGVEKISTEMPFFKESMYIDEELRQELNKLVESQNTVLIDTILNRIFDDQKTLLDSAAVSRERMRMMLLTTGTIALASNGQAYEYDYGIADSQKKTPDTPWDNENADVIGDIRDWQDQIELETGVKPTRAICDNRTWSWILKNKAIIKTIYALSDGNTYLSTARLKQYLMDELDLEVVVYSKKFKDSTGATVPYIANGTFVLFPEGDLGNTWFGTTPEESDLMTSNAVDNVAIVDTGVAITTMRHDDPVNVETKVTQICLPSFPVADRIIIADVMTH